MNGLKFTFIERHKCTVAVVVGSNLGKFTLLYMIYMGYLLLNRKSDKQFLPQQEVAECFNGAKVINIFGFINKSSFF